MEAVYSNIKERRKAFRMTQQDLATLMGYERSSIAKIEKGQVDLPLSKLREFAQKLELPFEELLGLERTGELEEIYESLTAAGQEELLRFGRELAGDSMEPYLHDGERVYVKRDESLRDFDVGIFFVDGDVYCKQWCVDYAGTTHLLSANPAREDASLHIARDSGRSVICFGKVLLKHSPPPPSYF